MNDAALLFAFAHRLSRVSPVYADDIALPSDGPTSYESAPRAAEAGLIYS